jgi:hypothetical protein
MRCYDRLRPLRAPGWRLLRVLAALVALMTMQAAHAHKSSDAYLQLDAGPEQLDLRWDIALRDLDVALDLDTDGDGRLTWREVKEGLPRIERYALPRIAVHNCPLRLNATALERRNDGAYVVLMLSARCALAPSDRIAYALFAEIDPTHRGIARISRAGQPAQLMMLVPAATSALPAPPGVAMSRWQFVREGIRHILTGYDHILFLLCLLIPAVMTRTPDGLEPVATLRKAVLPVLGIVSAFTVAHSITLGLAASKLVVLPPAWIEPAIALTIMLAAMDNIRPIFPTNRLGVAFAFGLIHGFGFAAVLAELNLPLRQFLEALLQFNVGLELGQLLIVCSAVGALFLLRRRAWYETVVVQAGSLVAFFIAALWLLARLGGAALLPF